MIWEAVRFITREMRFRQWRLDHYHYHHHQTHPASPTTTILPCRFRQLLFQRHVGIGPAPRGCELDAHLGLHGAHEAEAMRNRAVAIYALHRSYNALRRGVIGTEDISGAFCEYVREGRRRAGEF